MTKLRVRYRMVRLWWCSKRGHEMGYGDVAFGFYGPAKADGTPGDSFEYRTIHCATCTERTRLRIRWPILLAYALCFGTAHIIGAVFAWSVVATLALMFMFGAVVWAVLVDVAPDHTKRPGRCPTCRHVPEEHRSLMSCACPRSVDEGTATDGGH